MKPYVPGLAIAVYALMMSSPPATSSMPLIGPAPEGPSPLVQNAGGYWHPWNTVETAAPSGRLTRIRMYRFKCNVGGEGRPTISATASHGTVSIKDGVATTCDRKMPVAELWYQSEPGFHGVDEVMIGPPMYEAINVTVR